MNDPGLLVMVSLADGAKHGYAIQQDVERFADVRLGPGTLYGAINRLEDQGLIEALRADDRRRPYRLTRAGRVEVRERLSQLERIVVRGVRARRPRPA